MAKQFEKANMTKQFDKNTELLSEVAASVSTDKKATLILHCDEVAKGFFIGYSGKIKGNGSKIDRKHDELIMRILIEDDEAYKFIERIFTPVQRYRRRQQKKVNYAAPQAAYYPNPKQEKKIAVGGCSFTGQLRVNYESITGQYYILIIKYTL